MLGLVALVVGAVSASASADPYGELGKPFGSPAEINPTGPHAFGVDPTDDSAYVADGEFNAEGELARFSIKRFNAAGHVVASVSFEAPPRAEGVEGVAVDPALHRIYVLASYERVGRGIDQLEDAAGEIYAFSTEHEGELVSLVKNAKGEPAPFVSKEVLKSQNEKTREALLKPAGIAVDPTDNNLLIVAREDIGKEEVRPVLQQVHPDGSLGNRFEDDTDCLAGEEVPAEPACTQITGEEPSSPIVSPSGKVYIEEGGGQIWQIPTTETKQVKAGEFEILPKRLFQFAPEGSTQRLVEFVSAGEALAEVEEGDEMSFVSEGEHEGKFVGKIYLDAAVNQSKESIAGALEFGGFASPGVYVLDYQESKETGAAQVSPEGWTGGPVVGEKCAIEPPGGVTTLIGGGGGGVFVLGFGEGAVEEGHPEVARVSKFGPSGEGCEHARGTKAGSGGIIASTAGKEAAFFLPTQEVTLSTEVFEGNALSAKWELENTSTKKRELLFSSSKAEYQTTSVPPRLFPEGEYKVFETIHTDNLASPEIALERNLDIEVPHAKAEFFCESFVFGHPTQCNAEKSSAPPGQALTYEWSFGDGTPDGEGKLVNHTYAAEGSYTVTLTVRDAKGESSSLSRPVHIEHETTTSTPGSGGSGGGSGGGQSGGSSPPGEIGVKGSQEVHNPDATLAGTSLSVSSTGALVLKVSCPPGESMCSGTVTLRTLTAVAASAHGKKAHKAILTLATGTFAVAGGQVKAVTLHLSSKARALLAKSHLLRAQATLLAHDAAGASHTTSTTVTLRAAAKPRSHKKH